jgi:gliding motility-associated-like protein
MESPARLYFRFLGFIKDIPLKSFLLTIAFLLSLISGAFATHNRAGEIVYEHIGGLRYRVKIITYTKASSTGADRNYLKIRWGDEPSNAQDTDLDSLLRSNGGGNGVLLPGYNDVKMNEYVGEHTYTGPGTFILQTEDPNRNDGVLNIATGPEGASVSVMAYFALRTTLVIRPGNVGPNNSVYFQRTPIQNACIFQPWIHNPVAIDPDGDVLRYSLVACMGAGGTPLPSWMSPSDYTNDPNDSFTIDPVTGTITWQTPLQSGEYNVAIKVDEYRNGYHMGSVIRDMQITVKNCLNVPPTIMAIEDKCVVANGSLSFNVTATDSGQTPGIQELIAQGAPMIAVDNVATMGPQLVVGASMTREFSWQPKCPEVRLEPYQVSFIATDIGYGPNLIDPLSTFQTVRIKVVAPRVENPAAEAFGNQITLNWDNTICHTAFNSFEAPQVKYRIYRRNNLYGYVPDHCELGVPAYTGYNYIGQTEGVYNTQYVDTNVTYGGVYCYMVVTVWPDGSESYASTEFCDTVRKEVPVMTRVSINTTDLALGSDTVQWSKPSDLDTSVFPGPYSYRLFYAPNNGVPNEQIYESDQFDDLADGDTIFVHQSLNTQELSHTYRVQLYSHSLDTPVGTSNRASSVFLSLEPQDNAMTLQMNANVPWTNYEYRIYRKDPGASDFIYINSTTTSTYTDTALTNNVTYCYKVEVLGRYDGDDVPDVLINWSQEACAIPYDLTPPCAPQLVLTDDCEGMLLEFAWTDPLLDCGANDVTGYKIYFSPTEGGEMQLLATIDDANEFAYSIQEGDFSPFSIAGCYAVTALDSLNPWPDGTLHQNESPLSNIVCVDNCPVYELPNIFTPNGDGVNDFLKPIKSRYVQDVNFQLINRWGGIVFETTDPQLNWNGVQTDSGEICSDGVYYYVIQINFMRLTGIESEKRNGYIRIADGKKPEGN